MATKKATKPRQPRTPPLIAYPKWSEAKFWGYLRSGLRALYNKWPPKWEVLSQAKRAYKGPIKQQRWEFKCAQCEKYYKQKEVSVDHVIPAGALSSYDDIAGFVQRLFVGADGLQVLCKTCHDSKTQEERKAKGLANGG